MEKQYFNLMSFFNGYVRSYRRMNLSSLHNRSMFTKREIDYFAHLEELLGFDAFIEDSKFDCLKGRSRPMDLSWWKWDARFDDEYFLYLALHLERENVWEKDVDTIQKSNALMIYRYYDAEINSERIYACSFTPKGMSEARKAICAQDQTGYWFMVFEEEYQQADFDNEKISIER